MTIWFDMDGTLAALFFVKGFSEMLAKGDMTPYEVARPLYNEDEMKEVITALKNKGYNIGVISYADAENLTNATKTKMNWLKKYFPYATEIHITTKDIAKSTYYKTGDILVDDAKANRLDWESKGGKTINAYFRAKISMMDSLKELIKE